MSPATRCRRIAATASSATSKTVNATAYYDRDKIKMELADEMNVGNGHVPGRNAVRARCEELAAQGRAADRTAR